MSETSREDTFSGDPFSPPIEKFRNMQELEKKISVSFSTEGLNAEKNKKNKNRQKRPLLEDIFFGVFTLKTHQ